MGLLAALDTLIREHGSASIRADQIVLLRDQIADIDRKSSVLASENSVLEHQNSELQLRLEQAQTKIRELEKELDERNQFTESHGAYFKKDGRGGYHPVVYCGNCRLSTSKERQRGTAKFICRCGWTSSFTLNEYHEIMQSLTIGEHI
jgi:regulator of replication initiation timing